MFFRWHAFDRVAPAAATTFIPSSFSEMDDEALAPRYNSLASRSRKQAAFSGRKAKTTATSIRGFTFTFSLLQPPHSFSQSNMKEARDRNRRNPVIAALDVAAARQYIIIIVWRGKASSFHS